MYREVHRSLRVHSMVVRILHMEGESVFVRHTGAVMPTGVMALLLLVLKLRLLPAWHSLSRQYMDAAGFKHPHGHSHVWEYASSPLIHNSRSSTARLSSAVLSAALLLAPLRRDFFADRVLARFPI